MALTTATIIALGGAAVGGSMNLIQAGKARSKQREADKAAGRLMAEAKSKLEKNFYEGLKLPTEAYDQAYEANAQSQRENVEALQQADSRSLAAGVGKVGALSNENTQKIRAQQAQEMFELDKLKAGAKEDMNQQLAAMDVAGAQDQAARAAQADEQVGQLQAGAANAFIGGITSAAESQALNKVSASDKALSETFDSNAQSFKANNVSRNEFLTNPEKYQNLLPYNQMSVEKQKSMIPVTQPPAPSMFQPKVDFAFNFEDRMKSLSPGAFSNNQNLILSNPNKDINPYG
tara:strand:- start:7408 stop:8277 length:870 start_codon:yes stop_codon:yes gene_type:complete